VDKFDDRKREKELARAYVPFQPYCAVFPLDVSLMKGTIWTCLADYPPPGRS
jgi:hypothetical protein